MVGNSMWFYEIGHGQLKSPRPFTNKVIYPESRGMSNDTLFG